VSSSRVAVVILVTIAGTTASCGIGEQPVPVKGQVFIVTNARIAMKLPLVEVLAIEMRLALRHIDSVRTAREHHTELALRELDSLQRALSNQRAQLGFLRSTRADWTTRYIKNEISTEEWRAGDPVVNRATWTTRATQDSVKAATTKLQLVRSDDHFFKNLPPSSSVAKTDADGNFTLRLPPKAKAAIFARAERLAFSSLETYRWIVPIVVGTDTVESLLLTNDNLLEASLLPTRASWK